MIVLKAKTSIAAGSLSDPVIVDGYTSVSVKCEAGSYQVEVQDEANGIIEASEIYRGPAKGTIVAKTRTLWVRNLGTDALNFSVHA